MPTPADPGPQHRSPTPRGVRQWTVHGPAGAVDVDVDAPDDAELSAVLPALAEAVGHPVDALWHGSARLADGTPLADPALGHGAALGAGRAGPRGATGDRGSALELHVVGGPDAGRSLPLASGRLVVGRGAGCGFSLTDPDVSRRHVRVDVGDGVVTVADLGSANGSRLGDEVLGTHPLVWGDGQTLGLGATTLRLAGPGDGLVPVAPATAGRLLVRPHRRLTPPRVPVEVTEPAPPTAPPRRRLGWVAIALPAVGGVVMAVVLDAPHFLFFALLSPVVGLGTWLSDGWSGRRRQRREVTEHALRSAAAHRELAAALALDRTAAEAASPDSAALTSAARRRSWPLWHRAAGDPDALVVRVGCGPGPTLVTRREGDGRAEPVRGTRLPVTVDLRAVGVLGIVGPRPVTERVAAALLVQLTGLHPPGALRLALLTTAARAPGWAWTRWLPHLDAGTVPVVAADGTDDAHRAVPAWTTRHTADPDTGWLVVLVDRPLPAGVAAGLTAAAAGRVLTVCLAETADRLPVPAGGVLAVRGETGSAGVLSTRGGAPRDVDALDLVPARTAADHARSLAPLEVAAAADDLPGSVRLVDVLPAGGAVSWSRSRTSLTAVLGTGATGTARVDLCADGPHALVAGTTGAGKSELLQTLVTSLALAHPPDRCSFLLVDYKGGAAFADTAAFPHTVGMVTDLDPQSTARALRSLTAELTRREHVLAAHGVRDLGELPDTVDLARLVIVVDEFASLAEELPAFVTGLVGIAQRGRSLGVHLVLATQRPAGVVSPEIRANTSLRLCLRTTDEADSRDVLGTPAAAHLPADRPGRAWLRRGNGAPVRLQVARVSTTAPQADDRDARVARARWPRPAAAAGPQPVQRAGVAAAPTDLAELARALTDAGLDRPRAHRPWQPPLPDHLPAAALRGDPATPPTELPLGLVDRPDAQAQDVLSLDLSEGGTWLAVGGPRSGRTTLLRSVLTAAVSRLPAHRLHVHVLDHGGGTLAAEAGGLPQTGTTVGAGDALRTVRLVHRLAEEVARRRSAGAPAGGHVPVLLLVDGVESVSALLDEADPSTGSAGLLRLLRDGPAAGLTCVATGDRAVPGGRLAAVATRRLVLPLPDRADYAVAGVPARQVPAHRPPGRALVGEDAWECQLVLPPTSPTPARDPAAAPPADVLRIPVLPLDPWLPLPSPRGDGAALWLPVGPGGDEGAPVGLDLLRSGGLLVCGPPGSGRSGALDATVAHLDAAGVPVLRLTDGTAELAGAVAAFDDARAGRPAAVVVDDVTGLPDDVADQLALRCRPGRGLVLVGAGSAGELSAAFRGPAVALRRSRHGLLLRPGPGDADVLGVRLPRTPVPDRPGSGWLVVAGVPVRVQVARHRRPAPATAVVPGPAAR